jgi:DNA-binding CsgD family transcriptional regulator/tetratricopeptide (TPR) repeat protein
MREAAAMIASARVSTTFVGRGAELATFDELLARTGSGRAATVLLAGDAGMGKTRLAGELRVRARAGGALVATARTPVEGAVLPFAPVVALVRDLRRQLTDDECVAALEPVEHLLAEPSGDAHEPGRIARLLLFEAFLQAIVHLAAARPVVAVFEDVHWADAGTIELLDHAVRNLDEHAVLLVATFRPTDVEDGVPRRVLTELHRHGSVTAIDLEGLTRDEVAELATAVAGGPVPWTVVDAVHRRSEGNPLFVEELVAVRDRDELPRAVRDLLVGRVDGLSPDARRVVAAAAVLGVVSDHRLLDLVAEIDGGRLDEALNETVRSGVMVVDGGAGTVRFRHALLRVAAHDALLPAERARLHRRAAQTLRERPEFASAGPGHAAAQLAEHHFEAAEWPEACVAAVAAARAANALYAVHAAHSHLQRALVAHQRAGGGRCGEIDEGDLYVAAAEAAYVVGEMEAALALARDARRVLGPSAPAARTVPLLVLIARSAWALGLHADAFAAAAGAADAVAGMPLAPEVAEATAISASLLMSAGRSAESVERCEVALRQARACGARSVEAHVLATLGPSLVELGELDRSCAALHEAAAIADELGDPDLIVRAYNNYGFVLVSAGRLDEAAGLALDAMDDPSPRAALRFGGIGFNAAEALIVLGRFDDAQRMMHALQGKASAGCASDTMTLAMLAKRRGDLDAAANALEHAPGSGALELAQWHILRGELALEQNDVEAASAEVDAALAVLVGYDATYELLCAHAVGLQALADEATRFVAPRRPRADQAKLARLASERLAEAEHRVEEVAGTGSQMSPYYPALLRQCRAEAARVSGPDPAAWAVAAESWSAFGDVYRAASCRWREAEALLAGRGDRKRAVAALVDAWSSARDIGARSIVRQCERLAERAHVPLDDYAAEVAPRQHVAADLGLTAREGEVLELLARGCTDGEIAGQLFISKKTASVHVSNILRKLDAPNRWHAAEIGRHAGLGEDASSGRTSLYSL